MPIVAILIGVSVAIAAVGRICHQRKQARHALKEQRAYARFRAMALNQINSSELDFY